MKRPDPKKVAEFLRHVAAHLRADNEHDAEDQRLSVHSAAYHVAHTFAYHDSIIEEAFHLWHRYGGPTPRAPLTDYNGGGLPRWQVAQQELFMGLHLLANMVDY